MILCGQNNFCQHNETARCTGVVLTVFAVSRQFCTDYVYIKTFKKLLRDIIKRNPEGVSVSCVT